MPAAAKKTSDTRARSGDRRFRQPELLRSALVHRFSKYFDSVAQGLNDDELEEAVREPEDFEALIFGLQRSRVVVAGRDPLVAARLRGLEARKRLADASGGMLSTEQVRKLLGDISSAAITKQRKTGKLLGIKQGRSMHYPAIQFDERGVIPGLAQTLRALGPAMNDGWAALRFLTSPNERLGGVRPIDALKKSQLDRVVRAAKAFGEHGAD